MLAHGGGHRIWEDVITLCVSGCAAYDERSGLTAKEMLAIFSLECECELRTFRMATLTSAVATRVYTACIS